MRNKKLLITLLAEFFGVFILGSVLLSLLTKSDLFFSTALAVGVTLFVLTIAFSQFSGAHFNPAITAGSAIMGKISPLRGLLYLIAQFLGGYAALVNYNFISEIDLSITLDNSWSWQLFDAELVGTLVFATVYFISLLRKYPLPLHALVSGLALAIGMTVASIGDTGLINPALSLASSDVKLSYLVAPIVGGIVAVYISKYLSVRISDK